MLVVGAAIVRDGRVLACRRTAPAAYAGGWELPGGKVEPGETPERALVREVREELRCGIAIEGWLAGEVPIRPGYVLRAAVCRLVEDEPDPVEHDALRWLSADELDDVAWLAADLPFLPEIGECLRRDLGSDP